MPRLLYTVDDLVSQVRSQLDEENIDSVSTDNDILPALNRAQDFAADIYAKHYPEPFLAYTTLTLSGGVAEYDMPEDLFEDRVEKVEISINQTYREVKRLSYRDITIYESSTHTDIPVYYVLYGRKIRFLSTPSGTYNARMWYVRNPEKLVLQQGRITVVNSASNYVTVDSAGSALTTEADQLGSYVNFVDGQTGEIKGSAQIQRLSDNRITVRTSPTRSTVLNRTISSLSDLSIGLDDYLCSIDGTCVPYFSRPTSNFLIQYAVSEITRKLGGAGGPEEEILNKFEQQVQRSWAGREQSLRIKKDNNIWSIQRRWWPRF